MMSSSDGSLIRPSAPLSETSIVTVAWRRSAGSSCCCNLLTSPADSCEETRAACRRVSVNRVARGCIRTTSRLCAREAVRTSEDRAAARLSSCEPRCCVASSPWPLRTSTRSDDMTRSVRTRVPALATSMNPKSLRTVPRSSLFVGDRQRSPVHTVRMRNVSCSKALAKSRWMRKGQVLRPLSVRVSISSDGRPLWCGHRKRRPDSASAPVAHLRVNRSPGVRPQYVNRSRVPVRGTPLSWLPRSVARPSSRMKMSILCACLSRVATRSVAVVLTRRVIDRWFASVTEELGSSHPCEYRWVPTP